MSEFVAELARGDGPVRATGVANPRSGSWVVGDVRLDGRAALRAALAAAGAAHPSGDDDRSLVFAAWTAWGERAVERLRGDFSFALWDSSRCVLLCARDALGVRPLYWAEFGDRFVCGNVLDSVLAHPRASRRLHDPAIVSFLRHGFNADMATTSFADVRRLPPAHQLLVQGDGGAGAPRRHWSFPVPEPLRLRRDEEYVERFHHVLGEAVRDRLRVSRAAILLSGGLDSTSLAATARRVAPATELNAWTTVISPKTPPDESQLASAVATRLGIRHEIVRDWTMPFAHLSDPAFRSEQPLDEPDWGEWTRLVARIAADAPVLIVGEDGDALFRPPGLLTMLRTWPAYDVLRRVASYTIAHRHHPHLGVWLRRRISAPFKRIGLHGPPMPAWIRRNVVVRAGDCAASSPIVHPTRPDAHRLLSDPVWQGVLEVAQPAYTHVPLEIVWPLLDTRVMEFVFSIPPVPWCQRKQLLRLAFRGELPDEILRRPKTPLRGHFEWQVEHWRGARLHEKITFGDRIHEFVDTRSVTNTLRDGSVEDVFAAWRVLALDHWLRGLASGERSRVT